MAEEDVPGTPHETPDNFASGLIQLLDPDLKRRQSMETKARTEQAGVTPIAGSGNLAAGIMEKTSPVSMQQKGFEDVLANNLVPANSGMFASLLNEVGNPHYQNEEIPLANRVGSFVQSHANANMDVDEAEKRFKAEFPGIDFEPSRKSYEQMQGLALQRENFKNAEEKTVEYLKRHAVPFASANQRAQLVLNYKGAVERYNRNEATETDLKDMAAHERLQQIEKDQGIGGQLTDAAVGLPAIAFEAYVGHKALGVMGRAVGVGAAPAVVNPIVPTLEKRMMTSLVKAPLMAPLMPSMYLDKAAQNALEKGGDPVDIKNLGPAMGTAVLQVAVLEAVMGGSGAPAGLGSKVVSGAKYGVIGQQAVDIVATNAGFQTGYGVLGEMMEGNYGNALKHATVQAFTFAMFSALHGGDPKKTVDAYKTALAEAKGKGMNPNDAANYALGKIAEVSKPVVEKANKGVPEEQKVDLQTPKVDMTPKQVEPTSPTEGVAERTPEKQAALEDLKTSEKELSKSQNDLQKKAEEPTDLPFSHLDGSDVKKLSKQLFGKEFVTAKHLIEKLRETGMSEEAIDALSESSRKPVKTAARPEVPLESSGRPAETKPTQGPTEPEKVPPASSQSDISKGDAVFHVTDYKNPSKSSDAALSILGRKGSAPRPLEVWDAGEGKGGHTGYDANLRPGHVAFEFDTGGFSGQLVRGKAGYPQGKATSNLPLRYNEGLKAVHMEGKPSGPAYEKLKAMVDEINTERADAATMKDYGHKDALPPVELIVSDKESRRTAERTETQRTETPRTQTPKSMIERIKEGTRAKQAKAAEIARPVENEKPVTAPPKPPERVPLTDRERVILERRRAGETQEAIGQDMKITRERVRQIEKEALEKEGEQLGSVAEKQLLERQQNRLDAIDSGRTSTDVEPGDLAHDPKEMNKAIGDRAVDLNKKDAALKEWAEKFARETKNGTVELPANREAELVQEYDRLSREASFKPEGKAEEASDVQEQLQQGGQGRSNPAPTPGRGDSVQGAGSAEVLPRPATTAEAPGEPSGRSQARAGLSMSEKMRRLRPVAKEYEGHAKAAGFDAETIHLEQQKQLSMSRGQVAEDMQLQRDLLGNLTKEDAAKFDKVRNRGFGDHDDEWQKFSGMDRVMDYAERRGIDKDTAWDLVKRKKKDFKDRGEEGSYRAALDSLIAQKERAAEQAKPPEVKAKEFADEENSFDFGANVKEVAKNFLADESGAVPLPPEVENLVLGEEGRRPITPEQADAVKSKIVDVATELGDQYRELGGAKFPRTTRLSARTGEKMSQIEAVDGWATLKTPELMDLLLGDKAAHPEATKMLDLWLTAAQELRFRTAKVQMMEASQQASNTASALRSRIADMRAQAEVLKKAGDTTGANIIKNQVKPLQAAVEQLAKKATQEMIASRKVTTFVGAEVEGGEPFFKTDSDYYAVINSPEFKSFRERWVQHVKPIMEKNYRDARGMEDIEEINDITQIPGFPINAKAIQADADVTPGTAFTGGSRGRLKNQKTPTSPFINRAGLDANAYSTSAAEILENTLRKGTKPALRAELIRNGIEDGVFVTAKSKPEGFTESEFTNLPERTPGAEPGHKLYVKDAAAEEYRRLLGPDKPPTLGYLTDALNLATRANTTISIGEAATHTRNLLTTLLNPRTFFKFIGSVKELIRGDKAANADLVELARIGATKPEGFGHEAFGDKLLGKWNPATAGRRLIEFMDKAVRIASKRSYKWMVEDGLMPDTETGLRDFVNQAGNYSRRSQHKIVALARDLGIAPFATAGSNFWVQGFRALTFSPGVEATSYKAAFRLRAEKFAAIAGLISMGAIANKILWGRWDGDDNTPAMAIKTGQDGPKSYSFDLGGLTGYTRGLRETGALALMQGFRRGTDAVKVGKKAGEDVIGSVSHPLIGPGAGALWTIATGKDTLGRKVSEGDNVVENAYAALKNLNPTAGALLNADAPGKDVPMSERAFKTLGSLNPRKAREGGEKEVENFYDKWKDVNDRHSEATKHVRMGLKSNIGPVEVEYKRLKPIHDEMAEVQRELKGEQEGGRGIVPDPSRKEYLRRKLTILAERALILSK